MEPVLCFIFVFNNYYLIGLKKHLQMQYIYNSVYNFFRLFNSPAAPPIKTIKLLFTLRGLRSS